MPLTRAGCVESIFLISLIFFCVVCVFEKVSKFQKGFKLSFSIMEWMAEMEKEVVEYIKLLNCDMV